MQSAIVSKSRTRAAVENVREGKISLALIEAIYFILTKDDEEGKKK